MVKVLLDKFPVATQGTKSPGMYMDGLLKENLDVLKQAVQDDWDGLILVDGVEGSGKSVLAQQCGFYLDPTLTMDRIVFGPVDFKKAVLKAGKYQVVIYDEAYGGLASRKTMSETNFAIVSMLTEVRQKNLFLFVVMPTFFDLDRYVALWRSRALLHVLAEKFQRGFFKFFSQNQKKELYVYGKKFYNYKAVKSNFEGRFTNFYPCGKEEYQRKKKESLSHYADDSPNVRTIDIKKKIVTDLLHHMLFEQKAIRLTTRQAAALTGISRTTIIKYHKEMVQGQGTPPYNYNLPENEGEE